ncbi:GDP-mannose 4,6-dehydratase [bacterium]|nr:GDP-mannose 4,6-dehydratase [bacterium]
MRFLVTGGAGFIGSHLSEKLIGDGHYVVCIDNFNDYYDPKVKRQNISELLDHDRYTLIEADILDTDRIDSAYSRFRFDAIVHLAARAGVRPSLQQPLLYEKVNIEGTMHLLDAAVRHDVAAFVMASSSSVYGNNKKVPFSESDSVDHPISPYAATKKACELIGYTYHHLYGLPVTCLRFFTVYGPRQRPDMAITKFTRSIARGEPIPVYGDGTSRRDYTYISDIIDGIMRAIDNCRGYHVYNLGESHTIELQALIGLIERALGIKAHIDRQPDQPGDVRITYADITRAKSELGYNPHVGIEEGILNYVEWFRQQNGIED